MRRLKLFISITVLLLISGCQSSFGPRALEQTHPAYNQAISNSIEQEMLLNLVRLKYRDRTYFLQISTVTASMSLETSAEVSETINAGAGNNLISPFAGIIYADRPTISYTPLQGEEFLKSVLTPISLEAVLVMIQSGWSIKRVFGLSLERMNDLYNAPSASGPTPEIAPKFRKFKRMLELFRELQLVGDLEIGPDLNVNTKTKDLIMLFKRKHVAEEIQDELGELLGRNQNSSGERKPRGRVKFSTNFVSRNPDNLTVRTRSISSLMHYLSQNIDIPKVHEDAGLITTTRNEDGSVFDWGETPAGALFKIRSSQEKPLNARIAIPYRGYWFYLADNDLESKSTFLLLMQLFSLQAGQNEAASPTLTIPVGG